MDNNLEDILGVLRTSYGPSIWDWSGNLYLITSIYGSIHPTLRLVDSNGRLKKVDSIYELLLTIEGHLLRYGRRMRGVRMLSTNELDVRFVNFFVLVNRVVAIDQYNRAWVNTLHDISKLDTLLPLAENVLGVSLAPRNIYLLTTTGIFHFYDGDRLYSSFISNEELNLSSHSVIQAYENDFVTSDRNGTLIYVRSPGEEYLKNPNLRRPTTQHLSSHGFWFTPREIADFSYIDTESGHRAYILDTLTNVVKIKNHTNSVTGIVTSDGKFALSDDDGYGVRSYFFAKVNARIVDFIIMHMGAVYLIDEHGKMWYWKYKAYQLPNNESNNPVPITRDERFSTERKNFSGAMMKSARR